MTNSTSSTRQVPRGPEAMFCPFQQSTTTVKETLDKKGKIVEREVTENKKPMSETCHLCPMWAMVRGADPQTGADIDRWDCAIALTPQMTMQAALNVRQVQAATESFRNEMVKGQAQLLMQNERQYQISKPADGVDQVDDLKLLEN